MALIKDNFISLELILKKRSIVLLLLSGSKSEIMRHNFGTYLLPLPLELALDAYNSYYNYDGLSSHTLMNKKFLI